jgi:hypothetical protein
MTASKPSVTGGRQRKRCDEVSLFAFCTSQGMKSQNYGFLVQNKLSEQRK